MNTRLLSELIFLATFMAVSNSQRARNGHPLELVFLAYKPPRRHVDNIYAIALQSFMFDYVLDSFVINDNQTRIAVVLHHESPTIVTNLTVNTTVLRSVTFYWTFEPSVGAEDALKLVREVVFVDARPTAKKALFLSYYKITKNETSRVAVEEEAKKLRNSGIDIFVAAEMSGHNDPKAIMLHVSRITGDDKKRYNNWSDYSSLLDHMREYYQCHQEKCKYVDRERQQCSPDWYGWNCSLEKPSVEPEKVCQDSDCEDTCDEAWPWTREKCSSDECGNESTITVNRSGPNQRYDSRWYEHCIFSTSIPCPPCPPTVVTASPGRQWSGKGKTGVLIIEPSKGPYWTTTKIAIAASVGAVVILAVIFASVILVVRCRRRKMLAMFPQRPMPHRKVMSMPSTPSVPPPPVSQPRPPVSQPPPSVPPSPPPVIPGAMPPVFPVIQAEQGRGVSNKNVQSRSWDVRQEKTVGAGVEADLLDASHSRSNQSLKMVPGETSVKKKPTTNEGK